MDPISSIPPRPLPFDSLPPLLQWGFRWLEHQPILAALLALMAIDIVCGLFLSAARKTLSSSVSWRGMSKKAIMLLMVGVAAVLEPFTQGIPLSRLVGIFYICTESLSILENAAAAGVPLPQALIETLAKLKESQRAARNTVAPSANVTLEVQSTIKPENMVIVTPERPPATHPTVTRVDAPKSEQ